MSKHKPENRAEFKAAVLRKLGAPVIKINVSDEQVEDCIEEAIKYFRDYHYDGSTHVYYKHAVTADDITNRWIPIPETIFGVVQIYSLNTQTYMAYSTDMFSGGYQMAYEFAFSSSTGTVLSYYMSKMAYELINHILIGETPLRYNRHDNKMWIDFNWSRVVVGSNIIVDAYQSIDFDVNTDVWNDRWLMKYTAAKIKYIWGSSLSKFDGVQLPGGGTLNGARIQDDAKEEIQQLEDEMLVSYSVPPRDWIG